MNRCLWLICESQDRWQRGLARFNDGTFDVRAATSGEIRALAVNVRPLVTMWEMPDGENEVTPFLRSLFAISRTASPPLQMIVFPATLKYGDAEQESLSIMLRQTGADLILRDPEHLPIALRLATNYARRTVRRRNV
jgi:hypothetical protein